VLQYKVMSCTEFQKLASSEIKLLSSRFDLFSGVAPEVLEQFGGATQLIELPARHFLFRAGDPIRYAYFLVSGLIKRGTTLADGREKVIELVHPRQMVAMGELLSAPTYTSFAEAQSPCVVISVAAETFLNRMLHDIELSTRLLKLMAQRQCAIEFEATRHHASVGPQRVLDYLMEIAGNRLSMAGETTVYLESSKKLIASRLGMAPETFSRTLHQLAESGAIVVDGRRIHIQNAALAIKGSGTKVEPMRFSRRIKAAVQDQKPDISPAALINLCGRQRFLSQLMATSWALIKRNLMPRTAKVELRQHCDKFERNLARLDNLWLDDQERRKFDRLRELWPLYRELLMIPPPVGLQENKAFELSEDVLDAADQLTLAAEMRIATIDGHLVNIAGRNRMLSARMTKLFLFRDWRMCEEKALTLMEQSQREFEANIAGLTASCTDVPEATAQLHVVREHWQHFTACIDKIPARSSTKKDVSTVLAASEALLRHVDSTVKMYERMAE
jgi:CRP-like cAMP-binding protein